MPVAENADHSQKDRGWRNSSLVRPVAQFILTALLMCLLYGVRGGQGHLLYMWPITGVQLAILLSGSKNPRECWMQIAAGALGMFLSGMALGNPLWLAAPQSSMHALELWILRAIMSRGIRCFEDLKKQANVVRFCASALVVPFFTGVLIAVPLASATHRSILQAWAGIVLSDSLGIAVFTPLILLLLSGRILGLEDNARHLRTRLPALILLVCVLIFIFTQNTNPYLFLAFPPLILVVFVMGLEGAVYSSVFSSVIACWAMAHGQGPLWIENLVRIEHRIFVLQLFLWTTVACSLPIGSLLDERREAERLARESQTIYQLLLENSDDMIVLSTLDGNARFVSPGVERVTGWSQAEYLAIPPARRIHPEDLDQAKMVVASLAVGDVDHIFRHRALLQGGGWIWVEARIRGYRDSVSGPITGYVATVRDISAQKQNEDSWFAEKAALAGKNEQLATLAAKDELTGIANRRTFNQALSMEAKRHMRSGDSLSLLMIDVDSFKKFNDRYGHHAGDVCLQKVAATFATCSARAADLAARVGGEEFAMLLPSTNAKGAMQVADDILLAIANLRIAHEDSDTGCVSVSIGISTWLPYQATEVSQLIQQADGALYQSKSSGRNRSTVSHTSAAAADDAVGIASRLHI